MRKGLWLVEPELLNADRVVADIDVIRQYNPQRFEMEQLTAVVYEDTSRHHCIGYKDLAMDEFWVRGHVPHSPAMPMALMCEAAAQLANYYGLKNKLYASGGAFAGLTDVRCRGIVRPGERLFVMVRLLKIHSSMLTCRFQCVVRQHLVCDGILKGTPDHKALINKTTRPGQ